VQFAFAVCCIGLIYIIHYTKELLTFCSTYTVNFSRRMHKNGTGTRTMDNNGVAEPSHRPSAMKMIQSSPVHTVNFSVYCAFLVFCNMCH